MRRLAIIFFVIIGIQCRERYAYVADVPSTGMLVVEGMVLTNGESNLRLSRTNTLSANGIVPEEGAVITIEGEDNNTYTMSSQDSGRYVIGQLPLAMDRRYRIKISTKQSKEYVSDFRLPIRTQEIDSITYVQENDALRFYVNSTENNPQKYYFKYDWEETWQFNSSFRSIYKFQVDSSGDDIKVSVQFHDPIDHSADESIATCWQSQMSKTIDLGSTELLTASKIFLPVKSLRRDSWQLSYLYSLLVKQYALSAEGYDFFRRMKNNSESLGSIFDAQPSDIAGNIRNTNDPNETVVGFVEFTSVTEKRLFVRSEDLPGTAYDPGCAIFKGVDLPYPYPFANDPEVLKYAFEKLDVLPTSSIEPLPGQVFFIMEESKCVDCTLLGSNVKPSFWP